MNFSPLRERKYPLSSNSPQSPKFPRTSYHHFADSWVFRCQKIPESAVDVTSATRMVYNRLPFTQDQLDETGLFVRRGPDKGRPSQMWTVLASWSPSSSFPVCMRGSPRVNLAGVGERAPAQRSNSNLVVVGQEEQNLALLQRSGSAQETWLCCSKPWGPVASRVENWGYGLGSGTTRSRIVSYTAAWWILGMEGSTCRGCSVPPSNCS